MGTTFKCSKCEFVVRVSSDEELDFYEKEHKIICDGALESIWKNYDKMTKEDKEVTLKKYNPIFRYGVLKEER